MLGKINVLRIVASHATTLRRYRDKKLSKPDLVGFFGVPAVGAGMLVWAGVRLPDSAITDLITALSIFGALLFNLLILIYDVGLRAKHVEDEQAFLRRQLISEIQANVAFAVLTTVVTVALLVASAIQNVKTVSVPLGAAIYYLLFVFALTLLMILKRVNILMGKELEGIR